MKSPVEGVRIRSMAAGDLEQVETIARSLKDAPHWPRAAYLAALDPEALPQRIALIAEEVGDQLEIPDHAKEVLAGAKAHELPTGLSARLKSCPVTRRENFAVANGPSGRVLGFAVASVLAPQSELEIVAVAQDAHRRGVGGWLFDALTEKLCAVQVTELMLEVRAGNQPARGLYQARGFVQTGRRPGYYADPVEDAILLVLPLR